MNSLPLIPTLAFLTGGSLILLVALLVSGRKTPLDDRLRALGGHQDDADADNITQMARATLPRMGSVLVPSDEVERSKLQTRLIHAGLYGKQAMAVFLGVKLLLIVGPALVGLALGFVGSAITPQLGLMIGACLGIVGIIGPSFWLDAMKANRQSRFRRALPDTLDMMVVCLEGGLSLQNSLKRVGDELATAYPEVAVELTIVQREMQLGRAPGEAIRSMGQRIDLEELRSLASVIIQADRFGASLARALRVHAETLREKRQLRAEEMAQKAAVKLLVPTILFIFPAIFVVTLGPAIIHISRIMGNTVVAAPTSPATVSGFNQ
jgi:tight adherence protein C